MAKEDTTTQEDPNANTLPLTDAREERLSELADAPYKGPDEFSLAVTRSAVLGAMGWFAGKLAGDLGDRIRRPEKYTGIKAKTAGGLLAAAGVMLGAYTASKQTRDAKWEHRKMQKAVKQMYEQNGALKEELKEQLKAREGKEHNAKLNNFSDQWDETAKADTPDTELRSSDVEHQGKQELQAEVAVV